MSNETLELILNTLDDEKIEGIASQAGSERPRDRLMKRGRKIDLESVLWYIKNVLGESRGWFTYQINVDKRDTRCIYLIKKVSNGVYS